MAKKNHTSQSDTDEKVQFLLRFPRSLRDLLGQESTREKRSMTAQLIYILEERYKSAAENPLRKVS